MKLKYKEKIRVLQVTSELAPFAKAGGLGDVVGQLPKELACSFRVEIRVMMPLYKMLDLKALEAHKIIDNIKLAGPDEKLVRVSVWKTLLPNTTIPVYLIDVPEIFIGESVYDHTSSKHTASYAFYFLSKIALELIKVMDWQPDVVQCHDGMMGLIPMWLKTFYKHDPFYQKIASVMTIHNLNHQPVVSTIYSKQIGLRKSDSRKVRKFLKIKYINLMAEGIENADFVNTVSPTYAREVLTKKYGAGLHRLLRIHHNKFSGILNGFDYQNFDPRTNPDTPVKYWIPTLDKKAENKLFLQKKLGLTQTPDLPLICVVSRLTEQKGLDLIDDVLEDMVDMGAQFIILGSGVDKIEKIFVKAEKDHPKEIAAEIGFDANFAQTIYAGSDMLLMPSRFEPCGLSQIIAMRFGTIPIVRETGGLADTVKDGSTGFVFKDYDKNAFLWAIRRAVDVYFNDKTDWHKMQVKAMKKDFSWKKSAKKYIWAYKKAIANHKKYLESLENAGK